MDQSTLDGCIAKVDRADKHLQELVARVGPWAEDVPHEFRGEINPVAGNYAAYLVVRKAPPIEWSIIVGDVVHNLRSALDHIACMLVPKPTRATAFPIFHDREDFDCGVRLAAARNRRGPLTGLSPESAAFQFIEQTQPYRGPHGPESHPLFALRELSNEDKHRTVLGLAVGIPIDSDPKVRIVSERDVELSNPWVQTARPFQDGAQVMGADAKITGPDPQVEVEVDFPFGIAFGKHMFTMDGIPKIAALVREIVEAVPKIREG
jgi:hypothetical protein